MTIALTSSITTTSPRPVDLPAHPPREYTKPVPSTYRSYSPTHQGVFRVQLGNGADKEAVQAADDAFDSCLIAEKDLPPNTPLVALSNLSLAPAKAYSSVQFGTDNAQDHFELNTDLLFVNHSCNPNVAFDLSSLYSPESDIASTWHLKSLSRPIKAGEPLTFFYPSTEWDMDRGFDCACGEENCLGYIAGAKHLSIATLKKQEFVNPHIWELKKQQQQLQEQEMKVVDGQ